LPLPFALSLSSSAAAAGLDDMSNEPLTNVHVDLPNHWATGGESLWAADLGSDRYRLDNVPFYAYDLNFHGVVEAKSAAPELRPSVLRVVERSGHRTMRVFFADEVAEETRLARVRSLSDLHTSFERCSSRYFALDLEPEADADAVEHRLQKWIAEGIAEYETCEARVPGTFDDAPASRDGD